MFEQTSSILLLYVNHQVQEFLCSLIYFKFWDGRCKNRLLLTELVFCNTINAKINEEMSIKDIFLHVFSQQY